MDVVKEIVLFARAWRGLSRAFLLITLAICAYQVWRRWRDRRAIHRKVRGKVVLITGASSGLGEGNNTLRCAKDYNNALYSIGQSVVLSRCKGHFGLTQPSSVREDQIPTGQRTSATSSWQGIKHVVTSYTSPKLITCPLSTAVVLPGSPQQCCNLTWPTPLPLLRNAMKQLPYLVMLTFSSTMLVSVLVGQFLTLPSMWIVE